MLSSFESEPKPPAWPIAFCSDGAWLSVAIWSAAACCTSADSASSSWHSRGTAAACRSRELRSRPRLDSTLIVHESIVGSSVAESSWTSRPSTAGSAIAPRAFALQATSSASSDTACFLPAPGHCRPPCAQLLDSRLHRLVAAPRGARSEPGAVLTGIKTMICGLSERE